MEVRMSKQQLSRWLWSGYPCPMWQFWNPLSGAVGGCIAGFLVATLILVYKVWVR